MWPFGERFPYTDTHQLNLDWIIKTIKTLSEQIPGIETLINSKLNKPINEGNNGDILVNVGNNVSEWKTIDEALLNEISETINSWLDEHPEATTTVIDGSLTLAKFSDILTNTLKGITMEYNPVIAGSVEMWKNIPSGYSFPQGFCVINNDIYVGYSSPDNSRNAIIQKITNGVITNLTGEFYHMNSMCTDGAAIYSLDCLEGLSPSTTLNTITVIDISTFAFVERITINYVGQGNLAGLMYNNGLYVVDTLGAVYSVDNNYNLTYYCTLSVVPGTIQQTFIDNDFIYVSATYPNIIYIYKNDGTLFNTINIGNVIDNISPITELEAVYIYNNKMYIRLSTITNEDLIVKADLYTTSKAVPPMYDGNFAVTLEVDGNYNTQERINNHKFETLQNAINYASLYKNAKFIISLLVNSNEKIEINSDCLAIRIDSAPGIVFSGSIIQRAGSLTIQNMAIDLTNTDEFIYISNSTNADCYLNITGSLTGIASTCFIRTYGKCDIYCAVTGETNNVINLGAYANLELNANLIVNAAQYSNVYSNGLLNNISGFLRGGAPVAVPVDITLTTADTVITQTGRNPQQNTFIELRTENGCKNSFYLSTTNIEIQPFYMVTGNTFEIYYIRVRRDANNVLYAMLINPPSGTVKLNLIIYY